MSDPTYGLDSCDDCKFYVPPQFEHVITGHCHAHSPTIQGWPDPTGRWPSVDPEDWCGEFESRDAQ